MQELDIGILLPEKQYALFFDEVRVPRDHLLGQEGKGFYCLFDALNPEAATYANMAKLAAAEAAIETCDLAMEVHGGRTSWAYPAPTKGQRDGQGQSSHRGRGPNQAPGRGPHHFRYAHRHGRRQRWCKR